MKSKVLILALFAAFFTGCASTSPVAGMLYSDVSGPVATTHLTKGPLKGESCATSWLGMFAFGDASIAESAKVGGMNIVSHVDQHSSNIWFIKNTYCTITYGYKAAAK
jgi:TRL-like protein family